MWRPWPSKSKVKIHAHDPSSAAHPYFSCTSFKDVHRLCAADDPTFLPSSKKPTAVFRRPLSASASLLVRTSSAPPTLPESETKPSPPRTVKLPGIVLYFTSLRVVRRTFEDCRTVRLILRGLCVKIDERDLAMDSVFSSELRGILGGGQRLTLPWVFIGGRCIGGAEEVRHLHETGELKKLVEGLPAAELGCCIVCGGYRFVMCKRCDGSHRLYTEKSGFKSCAACNENGLVRCPSCSAAPF